MRTHLLSIFPMEGSNSYARVSLTPLQEAAVPVGSPFLATRHELELLLAQTSIPAGPALYLQLDRGIPVQIAISGNDALVLLQHSQGPNQQTN